MGKVSESIFSGETVIVPMSDVQHIEKHWYSGDDKATTEYRGIHIVTSKTTWNQEIDAYNNSIYLPNSEEEKAFLRAWCTYRHELESETILDLTTQK